MISVDNWSSPFSPEVGMADKTKRNPLILTAKQRQSLQTVAGSRTAPVREAERARILLAYADRLPLQSIARAVGVSRPTVYKCIDKALTMGWEAGLKDLYHRPKDPVITPEAKAWVVSIACTKPVGLGLAAEVWTHQALASYVRRHAIDAGYPSLNRAVKATVQRILSEQDLKPHTVRYYLERRDPDFDRKMREVLLVYREVFLNSASLDSETPVYTVSLDKKPGVQALGLAASDRAPLLESIRPCRGTTSMSGWERPRYWPPWISPLAMSLPGSRNGIGARSSSPFSRIWTPTIRRMPGSGSS